MLFPLNIIVAGLIAVVHTIISFSLNIPATYKTKFRTCMVLINLIFLLVVGGFSLFSRSSFPNIEIGTYFDVFAALYVLLSFPLMVALIVLLKNWVMKIDSFSLVTRYIVIGTPSIIIISLSIIGYYPFMLAFYGFAP